MATLPAAAPAQRSTNLALVLQELFTVVERLRSGRQAAADAASFRQQIHAALRTATDEAHRQGYRTEDVQLATFAVVAFIDESILNLQHPAFLDWARQPLQEELYGHHVAGEVFFQNLQRLLSSDDAPGLADLLEVYALCLLLGFTGRYSIAGRGELKQTADRTVERIRRLRGGLGLLSPGWALPPANAAENSADPWIKRLLYGAGASLVLALLLFIIFRLSLSGGVSALQEVSG